jgi:acyl-CoA thioesterase-1
MSRAEGNAVPGKKFANWAINALAVSALIAGVALPSALRAETPAPACDAPMDLIRLVHPLARVAHEIAVGEPITIVAMGSSSTAGAGASSPAANYPNQLLAELQRRFAGHPIVMINRGVNGEEVGDMLKRFDAVIDAKPDLVLWQLGTNSVLRDQKASSNGSMIRDGLRRIRAIGADIVLIDPQFTPKVIAKPEAERMVELLAMTAKQEDIDLFRRFEVMKRWNVVDHLPFETFAAPDGLHMNDWSYACMGKALGMAIAEAAQRPVLSATAGAHLVP